MAGTLAIDLGSTTTVVAFQAGAGEPPRLLTLEPYGLEEPAVVPSLVWCRGAGDRPLVGRQVLDAGLSADPSPALCRDFKRRIGLTTVGAGNTGAADAARQGLTAEAAGQLLLQHLWEALPTGVEPDRLVLTAPVESYRGYRRWLQDATRPLRIPEVALVDEPTAAAMGSGLGAGSLVLVIDLGGGTIDLSLVRLEGGEGRAAPIAQLLRFAGRDLERSGQTLRCARVLGKAGLALGGHDIDRWLAHHLCPDLEPTPALLELVERLKCQLSEAPLASAVWSEAGGGGRLLRLERSTLEQVLQERGLLRQLDGLLEEVLAAGRRHGLGLEDVDAVLPVGGASRMPPLQHWLQQRFPRQHRCHERPVAAVALGALRLTPGVEVKDVLQQGVSLRCWDQRSGSHRWHPLFAAGQSWPTRDPLELVLACSLDEQPQIELVLGQPLALERCEVVYEGGLPQLRRRGAGSGAVRPWSEQPAPMRLSPPGQRGEDRLRLRFRIDAEAMLLVEIEDLAAPRPPELRRLGPLN